MCENMNEVPQKIMDSIGRPDDSYGMNNNVDIQALNYQTAKELKALQYQLKMVVSSGNIHTVLVRTGIGNKEFRNEVEILEGTFNFFKIEMKGLLHPLKIYIKYL